MEAVRLRFYGALRRKLLIFEYIFIFFVKLRREGSRIFLQGSVDFIHSDDLGVLGGALNDPH